MRVMLAICAKQCAFHVMPVVFVHVKQQTREKPTEQKIDTHLGENVTRTGGIAASHQTGSELAGGVQQVDVVATHEILCHANDGSHQGCFAMVILGVLGDIPSRKEPSTIEALYTTPVLSEQR